MFKNSVVVLVAVSMSLPSYGRWSRSAARAQGQQTGNAMGAQLSNNAQTGQGTQATNYDSMNQASVDNMNNGQKGQTTAYIMYGALGAAANAKFSICGGSGFTAYAACIAGGILLGMAIQSKRSGDSFSGPINTSWDNVCQYSASGCNGNMPNPYTGAVNPEQANDQINTARRAGASSGISVDASTGIVRTKDGKEVDPNNPSSIEAVLGAESTKKLMEQIASIEKNAVDKVNKLAPQNLADAYGIVGAGGGAVDGTEGSGYADPSDPNGMKHGLAGVNSKLRKPAQVSGLSKNFNGDPIGVAADSIFGMMSRRYQLKHNQKTFLGPEVQ